MTQKDKEQLLKDLCARLPYEVKCCFVDIESIKPIAYILSAVMLDNLIKGKDFFKPYLRPMSSMTKEERKEYESFIFTQHHEWDGHGTSTQYVETDDVERYVTWLNRKMFDYRGLIEKGLAIEATKDMYKTE